MDRGQPCTLPYFRDAAAGQINFDIICRMCSNYIPPRPQILREQFGVHCDMTDQKSEIFPGYLAPIVRLAEGAPDSIECVNACFGMVPHWADLKLARHTYNARTETVAAKPSFRHAYAKKQFCIIPAIAIFEPSYESGHAVRWKLEHIDDKPLGIAGIWEWRPNGGPEDRPLNSFSMLTINADEHPLMQRFHRPEDEKRMVVLLEPEQFASWLHASPSEAVNFFQPYPADKLKAQAAPRAAMTKARPKAQPKSMTRGEPPSLWEPLD